jgi:hypothetical protein
VLGEPADVYQIGSIMLCFYLSMDQPEEDVALKLVDTFMQRKDKLYRKKLAAIIALCLQNDPDDHPSARHLALALQS